MLESVLFRKSFTKGYGNLLVFLDYKLHRASQGGDKNLFDMRKAGLTSLVNELHVKKGGLWGYLNKKEATHSQKLAQARKVMDPEEEQNIVGSVNAWNQSEERLYYVNKIKDVYDRCVNGKAIVKPSEFNTCVNFVHSAVLLGNGSRGGVIPSITNLEWGRRRVPDIDPDDEEDDGDSTRILDFLKSHDKEDINGASIELIAEFERRQKTDHVQKLHLTGIQVQLVKAYLDIKDVYFEKKGMTNTVHHQDAVLFCNKDGGKVVGLAKSFQLRMAAASNTSKFSANIVR